MKRPEDFGITKYKWIGDKLDVYQNVDLSRSKLIKFPFDFNIVHGNFNCFHNKLKSLKGCPKEVRGDFDCAYNLLESLIYCPKKINGYFDFRDNQIKTIKNFPIVKGEIYSNLSIEDIHEMIRIESNKELMRSKMKQTF